MILRKSIIIYLLILIMPIPLLAKSAKRVSAARPARNFRSISAIKRSKNDLIKLTQDYRSTLEKMLVFHMAEEFKAYDQEEDKQRLYLKGQITKEQLEGYTRALIDEKIKLINL